MNPYSYLRANDLAQAAREAGAKGAKVIAGGTNLLDLMKENVERPTRLIDINALPLDRIEDTAEGGLRIGALVRNADLAAHAAVRDRYPLLSSALLAGARPQLRNMATTGGNVMQRTRCYYFYDVATPCNKRNPGSGCGAIGGVNRIHAILGASDQCIATHPSDMCVAMAALEATINISGQDGDRSVPFVDFHRLPGDTPQWDNELRRGEIITSIDLPAHTFRRHYTYLKIRDRLSYAFALVSVAVALQIEAHHIAQARVALGGVAHKPWRRREAEQVLEGRQPDEEAYMDCAHALLAGARGQGDNDFKIELARRAIVRALTQAVHGTPQSQIRKHIV
jgi:xanthine dehydrogenase YagS FAD-binding subunit